MGIEFEDVSEGIRRVSLSGRLDIQGTGEIELKFAALTATMGRRVIVDMTAVDFLASIGIRALIANAKALHMKGGRMVMLVTSGSSVEKTLATTGVDTLVPMYSEFDSAMSGVLG